VALLLLAVFTIVLWRQRRQRQRNLSNQLVAGADMKA
jgi:hypothetical protein